MRSMGRFELAGGEFMGRAEFVKTLTRAHSRAALVS